MHIICPTCHNPLELGDASTTEILCTSCGSSFRLELGATTTRAASLLRTLGKFELLDVLGSGAFGTVYKARDPELDRVVAVKVPREDSVGRGDDLARFLREARNAAQLRHPGIVPVHAVGQHEGRPYLVCEYVPGVTLADWLTARRAPVRQAALWVSQIADALHYAHGQGVVHRDIKPSNIMLETAAGDTPRLMDFGLAKRDAGEITMTTEGQILGTPAYMSPEQARGQAHGVDGRSDVYSLGVVLYELLTGALPFRGNMRMLLHQVLHDEPTPPRRLNDRLPRDLETICLKALAREPARRYASAAALADDLRRYLEGRPILARPATVRERLVKWARRRPTAAALLGVSGGAVLAVLAVVLAYNFRLRTALEETRGARAAAEQQRDAARQANDLAEQRRAEAESRAEQAVRSQYAAQLALVSTLWETDPVRGRLLLHDAERCPVRLRDFTWGHLDRLCHQDRLVLRGHDGPVNAVAYSPDRRTLVTAGQDGTVRLWDAATGAEVRSLQGHKGTVRGLAFSPDGGTLATASWDGTVRLWDVAAGTTRAVCRGHARWVNAVAFAPDGQTLASASHDGTVRLWDTASGQERAVFGPHGRWFSPRVQWVQAIAFSPDGRQLASASFQGVVRVWDVAAGTGWTVPVRYRLQEGGAISSLAYSPDGKLLAWMSVTVKVWDLARDQERASFSLRFDGGSAGSLCFSPDGRVLITSSGQLGSVPGSIRLWDPNTGRQLTVLHGQVLGRTVVACSPDGDSLALGTADGAVTVWRLPRGPERATLEAHTAGTWALAFSPDGKTLASGCGEWWKGSRPAEVKLWDADTGRERLVLNGHQGWITAVAFSPDGGTVATASWDRTVKLWDARTGTETRSCADQGDTVWCLAFSPDGKTLATSSGDAGTDAGAGGRKVNRTASGEVRLRDAATGAVRKVLRGHGGLFALAYSPDGKTLAAAGWDGAVILWDADTGAERATLQGPAVEAWCLAFSPDGSTLAVGGGDLSERTRPGSVTLWDLADGRQRLTFRGHAGGVFAVAFSPDGRTLASGSNDGTVKLWDPETGQERAVLSGHVRWVRCLAFRGDGAVLASGSGDGTVKLWQADPFAEP